MKKTSIFALALISAAALFTSCEKDDPNTNTKNYTITDLGNDMFQVSGSFNESYTFTADKAVSYTHLTLPTILLV